MHCTHCGKEITPTTRFCPACGTPVADPAAPPGTGWQSEPFGGAPPPPPSGTYAAGTRLRPELLRPRSGRMLAGVCAAFARTYGWNVTIVRIILVVAALHVGLGLVAYVVAWIIIPEEPYLLPTGGL